MNFKNMYMVVIAVCCGLCFHGFCIQNISAASNSEMLAQEKVQKLQIELDTCEAELARAADEQKPAIQEKINSNKRLLSLYKNLATANVPHHGQTPDRVMAIDNHDNHTVVEGTATAQATTLEQRLSWFITTFFDRQVLTPDNRTKLDMINLLLKASIHDFKGQKSIKINNFLVYVSVIESIFVGLDIVAMPMGYTWYQNKTVETFCDLFYFFSHEGVVTNNEQLFKQVVARLNISSSEQQICIYAHKLFDLQKRQQYVEILGYYNSKNLIEHRMNGYNTTTKQNIQDFLDYFANQRNSADQAQIDILDKLIRRFLTIQRMLEFSQTISIDFLSKMPNIELIARFESLCSNEVIAVFNDHQASDLWSWFEKIVQDWMIAKTAQEPLLLDTYRLIGNLRGLRAAHAPSKLYRYLWKQDIFCADIDQMIDLLEKLMITTTTSRDDKTGVIDRMIENLVNKGLNKLGIS